jgi:hypothetical protein
MQSLIAPMTSKQKAAADFSVAAFVFLEGSSKNKTAVLADGRLYECRPS